jgi:hypothetical protein
MVEVAFRLRTDPDALPAGVGESAPVPGEVAVEGPGGPVKPRFSGLRRALGWLEAVAMIVALVAAIAEVATTYNAETAGDAVAPGVRLGGTMVGGLAGDELDAAARGAATQALDREIVLVAGDVEVAATARELGAMPAPDASVRAAMAIGRSGDPLSDLRARARARRGDTDLPVGLQFDEERALARLLDLVPAVDRPALPTRLDLAGRRVLAATRGAALLPYDSLSAVAVGLASGSDRIALVVQPKPPVDDPLAALVEDLDVSVVLGSFATPYSMESSLADRGHNLKLGAAAVSGTVLLPGETFSFNEVVGDRTAAAGYRYAPGITAGEMVDVLGGGICQISSTLYGAAFFAGVDLVQSRAHSRPSSYVDMGLDSTVAYPVLDLKVRNPFDFPIAIHMTVNQGKVRAEFLGERRPYQVAFEREIKETLPFRTIWRDDGSLRTGATVVSQQGKRGFEVERRRVLYQAGKVVREEKWELRYPSTSQIVRRGTNPAGGMPKAERLPVLRDPASKLRIVH